MPRSRQRFSNPSAVKQLPRSVRRRVTRKGKAASASSRKALALASVSSSSTARWTERERRSMATNRKRLRHSPSAVRSLGRCLADSSGRRNTSTGGFAMGTRRRRSDRSGRGVSRSPGRPGVARREDRRRFWTAIAAGRSSEGAGGGGGGVAGGGGGRGLGGGGGAHP